MQRLSPRVVRASMLHHPGKGEKGDSNHAPSNRLPTSLTHAPSRRCRNPSCPPATNAVERATCKSTLRDGRTSGGEIGEGADEAFGDGGHADVLA